MKYVCDIIIKKFTFAISSPDEFLYVPPDIKEVISETFLYKPPQYYNLK